MSRPFHFKAAEIEPVAIAMYESECRAYDSGGYRSMGNQLAYQDNQVRAAIVAWASQKSWEDLEPQERERYRDRANDMLLESRDGPPQRERY
jgi:hypothetical protein